MARPLALTRCCALLLLVATASCGARHGGARYIDLRYTVSRAGTQAAPEHAVDAGGALWYIDGRGHVVVQRSPNRRRIVPRFNVRGGTLISYAGAIYALGSHGKNFFRLDRRLEPKRIAIPAAFVPVVGVTADLRAGALIAAQTAPRSFAIVEPRWRWLRATISALIVPFARALAGGAHGRRFLVVGDESAPRLSVRDLATGITGRIELPQNACFTNAPPRIRLPVDVLGVGARVWSSSGQRVLSIDPVTHRVLRVWNVGACAAHLLGATARSVLVIGSVRAGRGAFASSILRVDQTGVHPLANYGTIPLLGPAVQLDAFHRIWWYDPATGSFICRTPLR